MNPAFDPELHSGLIVTIQVLSFVYGLLLALFLDDFKDVFRDTFTENKVVFAWFWSAPVILNLILAGFISWRTFHVSEEIRKAGDKIEAAERRRASYEDTLRAVANSGR